MTLHNPISLHFKSPVPETEGWPCAKCGSYTCIEPIWLYTCYCGVLWDLIISLNNVTMIEDTLQMAVPSNSALFKGMG